VGRRQCAWGGWGVPIPSAPVRNPRPQGLARTILKRRERCDVVQVEDVEPTNSYGERAIRPGAALRKRELARERDGIRCVASRMTVVPQRLNNSSARLWESLTAACQLPCGRKNPFLLPAIAIGSRSCGVNSCFS